MLRFSYWCVLCLQPFTRWHSLILSRPVGVKQLSGPSLTKLMAQFNTDVDSGTIRIVFAHIVPVIEYIHASTMTQACYRIRCSMVFQNIRCRRPYQRGTHPSETGALQLWLVSPTCIGSELSCFASGSVTGVCSVSHSPELFPSLDHVTTDLSLARMPWRPTCHKWTPGLQGLSGHAWIHPPGS